jgi:hypothetical protein
VSESSFVVWRRRLIAVAGLAALLMVAVAAARGWPASGGEGDEIAARAGVAGGEEEQAQAPPPPPELPRGGRRLFPDRRIVAFYGAPQDEQLGVLGIGTLSQAARKLERQARPYARKTRPVLPAFELIATIANAHPGEDGLYRTRQTAATIDRHLRAARRAKAMLILDIQPGRADFMDETRRLRRWLREPDVGLALDPEWHMEAGEVPGQSIGSVTAREVNRVSAYLAGIVRRHDLPEKLLLIHQFTNDMIVDKGSMARREGVALTVNVDGFGGREIKRQKYDLFTSEATRFHDGFKLFYEEDTNLMRPRHVLALTPPPDVVVYE